MKITLKEYATVLPKELILSAGKDKVRECDETEKGHFVAYVDEGINSYDVSLTITKGSEITAHSCDCKNGTTFCRHKAALLMHIANGKKIKSPVKTKKKENKTDQLLEQVEMADLKDWVQNLLHKNKDIALSFVHYFSTSRQQYTPEEVKKLVAEGIKVVLGNRKTAEAIQLKKLTELWSEMLAPVLKHYNANVMDENAFLNFQTLLDDIIDLQQKIETTSNKLSKFVEGILQDAAGCIAALQIDEAWNISVGYFVNNLFISPKSYRWQYLPHLKNIIDLSPPERKERIIDRLAKQYIKTIPEGIYNGQNFTKFIFFIISDNALFPRYYNLFLPMRYENDYNKKLIQLLVDNHHFVNAEKYCQEQIRFNFKDEFNIPYWQLLKDIYARQNDEDKLVAVLSELFPYTYDFDDYLFITIRMPEEERKKWRTKMLSRASNAANNRNTSAMLFCFWLMDHEEKYKKMIDYITDHTPYKVITLYFERMALTDKNQLIDKLIRKSRDYTFSENKTEDEACFPELFALTLKHYTPQFLSLIIIKAEKDRPYYRLNSFLTYAKERLNQADTATK